MLPPASNHNGNCSKLARSRFINSEDARPVRPLSWVRPEGASYLGFVFARGETPELVERALRTAGSKIEAVVTPRLPVAG